MMDFRTADTFTDCLARLSSDEQNAVNTTTLDLQVDPVGLGVVCESFRWLEHNVTISRHQN